MAYEAQLAAYKRLCDRVTTRMLNPLDAPTFWQDLHRCKRVRAKNDKVYCVWREAHSVKNSTMSTKFEVTERVVRK